MCLVWSILYASLMKGSLMHTSKDNLHREGFVFVSGAIYNPHGQCYLVADSEFNQKGSFKLIIINKKNNIDEWLHYSFEIFNFLLFF